METNQIMLAIFTSLAMFCTQQKPSSSLPKWACILGLCSQPFWFYASITAGQNGEVVVNVLATLIWTRGLWVFWIQPRRAKRLTVDTITIPPGSTK